MLEFKKPLKMYLFKDKRTVDLSLQVSDNYVQTYTIPQDTFQELIKNWQKDEGYSFKLEQSGWFVQYKKTTPRPESLPESYIRITVWNNGMSHNFRFEFSDMWDLEKEYFYQSNNTMYWD